MYSILEGNIFYVGLAAVGRGYPPILPTFGARQVHMRDGQIQRTIPRTAQ